MLHARPESTHNASRRKFLGVAGAGAGAAVIAATPGIATARRDGASGSNCVADTGASPAIVATPGRFTRMFEPAEFTRSEIEERRQALIELSRPGGVLDANDPLEVGPVRLITEPELSPRNRDNPAQTAGTTFVGQFLDHDITRDGGSPLGQQTSVARSSNLRSARFDLDSVYGGGPADSPDLYESDRLHLRLEGGGIQEDLPRTPSGVAIVADPRNDENLMISGLQCAFLALHNTVVDRVIAGGLDDQAALAEAQRQVRWHYQWMIMHEFLPLIVGPAMVLDVLVRGRRFYTPTQPAIPVEFQSAAYRFGHSMVRPSYRANLNGDQGEPFFGLIFDVDQIGSADPDHLAGGHRAPRRFIDWQTFFDFDDGEVKPNKMIDPVISTPLFRLPISTIDVARGEDIGPTSLATRNLLRSLTWQLPSGQDIARTMKVETLSAGDLEVFGQFGAQLDTSTPLWLYILREAELMAQGQHLGPVGGRIVAEVFIGLLQMDADSYLSADPDWRPTLPTRGTDAGFSIVDLLTNAGVDPASRAG